MGGEKEADLQREAEVRESSWAESLTLGISATLLPFRYSSQYIPNFSLAGSGWVSVTGNPWSMTHTWEDPKGSGELPYIFCLPIFGELLLPWSFS